MRAVLTLAILLALSYGGLQVYSQFQQQQASRLASGLKPIEVTQAAAQSFDDKVATLEKAADDARRTGRSTPVEVTFTEQELTSKLAEMAVASGGGLTASDMQIHFSGGNVIATSKVHVQGFDLRVGIVAVPTIEAGQAKLIVKAIETGGVPVPDALKQQIEARIGEAIDPSALGLPFAITKVLVLDGKVVLSGTAKP